MCPSCRDYAPGREVPAVFLLLEPGSSRGVLARRCAENPHGPEWGLFFYMFSQSRQYLLPLYPPPICRVGFPFGGNHAMERKARELLASPSDGAPNDGAPFGSPKKIQASLYFYVLQMHVNTHIYIYYTHTYNTLAQMSIYLTVYPSSDPSIHSSIYPFIRPCIHAFIYLYLYTLYIYVYI